MGGGGIMYIMGCWARGGRNGGENHKREPKERSAAGWPPAGPAPAISVVRVRGLVHGGGGGAGRVGKHCLYKKTF